MRLLLLLGGFWIAATTWLSAQVSVELVLEQEQFLPRESLCVGVRISNLSGQILKLGADDYWLRFIVESRDGLPVFKQGEVPVRGEFSLESSEIGTKTVDLAPYFPLTISGRYRVTATVRIPQWDRIISSPTKEFDIVKGMKLWEQEFGVPTQSGASNLSPEVRKYALMKAAYLKKLCLYVSISDPQETRLYRVFSLGNLVSFSQPEAQLDKASNLHVLYQSGARSFYYNVVSPDGQLILRQTHLYTNSRPTLRSEGEGKLKVVGGIRQFAFDDIPSAKTSSPPAPVSAPQP